jgi:hypothetical protein
VIESQVDRESNKYQAAYLFHPALTGGGKHRPQPNPAVEPS